MANGVRARDYLRVSADRSGRARSHDEQRGDHVRDADRQGWDLLPTSYRDIGGASRHSRKTRDGFDQLIADLESDRFEAGILMLWEPSRGSRRESEWLRLIELGEERGVRFWISTHARLYDPANARDRRSLMEDAIDSAYEASKTSDRGRRAAAAGAAGGKPHGRLLFGFIRRYDERSGRLIEQVPHPEEAPLVQEVFARVLRAESLRAVAADFKSRGIVNGRGTPFSQQHLRHWLLNPAYAGLRVHRPGTVGIRRVSPSDATVEAQWEALVSRADFLAVQAIINDPTRNTRRPGGARHLLSMIARCAECSSPVSVRIRRGREEYRCQARGCITILKKDLDKFATAVLLGYLSRPDVYAELDQADEVQTAELAKVREELAVVRAEIAELADALGRSEITVVLAARAERGLLERAGLLERREADLATPSRLRHLLVPGEDVRERWEALSIETKREVARLLFSKDVLGELNVTRSPAPGTRAAVEDRVRFDRESR